MSENNKVTWSSGLCDCCCGYHPNPCVFLSSICCGFVSQAFLLENAGITNSWIFPGLAYLTFDVCTVSSVNIFIFANLRNNIAKARGYEESLTDSYCKSLCCYPCAVAQVHRDIYDNDYKFNANNSLVSTVLGIIEKPHCISRQSV